MENLNNKVIMVASAAFLILSINFGAGDGETSKKIPTYIVDAAKRLLSLPTTDPADSWFLSPNLDFRVGSSSSSSSSGGDEYEEDEVEEASGNKVKDAVVKSLDKSRATVQDSAKSAAKTINNLKHKLMSHQQEL